MVVSTTQGSRDRLQRALLLLLALAWSAGAATGCAGDRWRLFKRPDPLPPGPVDSLVLRGDSLVPDKSPVDAKTAETLAGAHELYRLGEYAKAEKAFHKLASNKKNPVAVAEEALFYEAECLRRQEKYPKAADTYAKLLNDFQSGVHRDQALHHMFEIANYWLEDTRKEMRARRDQREGKRQFVWPGPAFHWEKSKPLLDEEGRAVEKLEQITYNAIQNPLGEQALFMLGTIKNYREDYVDADYNFTRLVEMYPNSPYAPKALEMAIFAKHMSTGGAAYDGRKVAEARELVYKAQANYPELARSQNMFLDRQLIGITMQQAEKDYMIAEFYRRRGHPGAAYFYYEIVRRRYPGTPYFDKATERMHQLRHRLEREQLKKGAPALIQQPAAAPPELAPPPRKLGTPPVQNAPPLESAPPPRKLPELPNVTPPPGQPQTP
jgi:outer membrane protein assembly factor BamD (BamD/ComL family)